MKEGERHGKKERSEERRGMRWDVNERVNHSLAFPLKSLHLLV